MNFVDDRTTPLCHSCGDELPWEPLEHELASLEYGVCTACFEDSQAKAAAQLAKEQAEQFRYASLEWFEEFSPEATERKAERYFYAATNYAGER